MRPRTATSWPCSRAHSRIEAFLARFECGGCEPLPPLERRRRPPPVPLRRATLTKGARAARSLAAFSSDSSTSYTRRSRPKVTVSEASDPSRSSTSLTRTVRATVRVRSEKCPCHPALMVLAPAPFATVPEPPGTLPRRGRRARASVISSATVGLTACIALWSAHRTARTARQTSEQQSLADAYLTALSLAEVEAHRLDERISNFGLDAAGQRHQRWLPAGSVTTLPLPRDDRFDAPALRRTQHVAVTPIDRSGPISSSISDRRTSARRGRVRPGSEPRRHRPAHSTGYRTLGVRERIGQHHGRWRAAVFLELRAALDPSRPTSTNEPP
jgi:hypothetical protein